MSEEPSREFLPGSTGDDIVIAAFTRDDPKAFEALRVRYLDCVYRLCWGILGHSAEAEDATQEAFIRAWLHRRDFRPGAPLEPWLYRIARNACLDRKRHSRFEADWDPEHMTRLPSCGDSLEHDILKKEENAALRDCLARLETTDRAIVSGFYIGDEEVRGVVVEGLMHNLGLGRRTVYDRLKKALNQLRDCLNSKEMVD